MGKGGTLFKSFVTITKRMPLKARVVLGLSLVIVIFELVTGYIELGRNNNFKLAVSKRMLPETGKIRERKEISEDNLIISDEEENDEFALKVKPLGKEYIEKSNQDIVIDRENIINEINYENILKKNSSREKLKSVRSFKEFRENKKDVR